LLRIRFFIITYVWYNTAILTQFSTVPENLNLQSEPSDTSTTLPEPTPTTPALVNIPLQINFAGDGQAMVRVGTQSCQKNCTVSVVQGEALSLLAQPSDGNEINAWQGDCSSNSNECVISSALSANKTSLFVTVTFKKSIREAHALLLLHGMNMA
jgi:hypothetical protein